MYWAGTWFFLEFAFDLVYHYVWIRTSKVWGQWKFALGRTYSIRNTAGSEVKHWAGLKGQKWRLISLQWVDGKSFWMQWLEDRVGESGGRGRGGWGGGGVPGDRWKEVSYTFSVSSSESASSCTLDLSVAMAQGAIFSNTQLPSSAYTCTHTHVRAYTDHRTHTTCINTNTNSSSASTGEPQRRQWVCAASFHLSIDTVGAGSGGCCFL